MIYGPFDKALLRYYVGEARISLACRIVYARYVQGLGARGRVAMRDNRKGYEYQRRINQIQLELAGYGVPWSKITFFLQEVGWM